MDVAILLFNLTTGGVERVAVHVANGLARLGLKVELVLVRGDGPLKPLLDPSVHTTILFPDVEGGKKGLQIVQAIPALARHIRRTRPKILFASGVHLIGYAYLASRIAGRGTTQLVLKLATNIFTTSKPLPARLVKYALCALAMRASRLILTIGPDGNREATKLLGKADPRIQLVRNPYVTVTPNAINVSSKTPRRQLLAVGRLTAQKDYPTLLNALVQIKNNDWHLTILGDGEDRAAVETLAGKLDIKDRITFAGYVIDPTPYYEAADIFVLSSRYEGLPAVILEAMAYGLPVIATASTDGISEILADGRFGILTPVGDADAFAKAVIRAMDADFDASGAQDYTQLYSLENGVKEHYEALKPLLSFGS